MALPKIIPGEENGEFIAMDSEGKKSQPFRDIKGGRIAINSMTGLARFEKSIMREALPGVLLTLLPSIRPSTTARST